MIYDYIIVGTGISGLYCAYKLLKKNNILNILILEKNSRVGGRILGYDGLYDAGAGRISGQHNLTMKLIRELNLKDDLIKINSNFKLKNLKYKLKTGKNLSEILKLLKIKINKNSNDLVKYSLFEAIKKYLGEEYALDFKNQFAYYSELFVMNAKDALISFDRDFSNKSEYYVLKHKTQSIIDKLMEYLEGKVKIKLNYEVKNIDKPNCCFLVNKKYISQYLILATTKNSLLKFDYFKTKPYFKLFDSVSTQPLYRIYAKFKTSWFNDMPKIITDSKIKFIIPINSKKGLIMISYTDGKYTDYWRQFKSEEEINKNIMIKIRKLFKFNIPEPIWMKHYLWTEGAHYWKKGFYSEDYKSKIFNPEKNLFIIGEAYSSYQAWIEGALETANKVLKNKKRYHLKN